MTLLLSIAFLLFANRSTLLDEILPRHSIPLLSTLPPNTTRVPATFSDPRTRRVRPNVPPLEPRLTPILALLKAAKNPNDLLIPAAPRLAADAVALASRKHAARQLAPYVAVGVDILASVLARFVI